MKLFTLSRRFKDIVEGLMFSISNTTVALKRTLQSWRWLCLACFIFLLCISPSLGQGNLTLKTGDTTASTSRGATITVSSPNPIDSLKKDKNNIPKLALSGEDQTRPPITGTIDEDAKVIEFIIPEDFQLGNYSPHLLVVPKDDKDATPVKSIAVNVENSSNNNKLTVNTAAGSLQPVITAISPSKVIFPYQSNSHPPQYHAYSFTVYGREFSSNPFDNHLQLYELNNEGELQFLEEPSICWNQGAKKFISNELPCSSVDIKKNVIGIAKSSRQLTFSNLPFNDNVKGIAIRVGDKVSQPPQKITLSKVPYQAPLGWTMVALLLLCGIIFAILSNSAKDKPRLSLLSVIIDPDTKTYSLSKFQFVLWTIVAILSYLYLLLSKSLAQGKLEFIDIPDGLPGIVLASAATAFFAIGVDNTKGGKASGPNIDPVWSDLISAGGSVLPDRLQFLSWTIIGVLVYIFLVLSQNPGVISDLPAIPAGFLQLSGVSAVGYLGGKLARRPGPSVNAGAGGIDNPTHDGNFLILTLNGHYLSKDASFVLIDKDSTSIKVPQAIGLASSPDDPDKTKARIQIIDPEPGDSTMASRLTIKIPSTPAQWPFRESNPYSITIINPDTQIAAWKFDGLTAEVAKLAEEAKAAAEIAKAAEEAKLLDGGA